MTIHAIYENGVFRPLDPVQLPERTLVLVVEEPPSALPDVAPDALKSIYEVMSRRFDDPHSPGNLAERHNEHQP